MGTRNLTMVISNGKTKVAQYGQWDGYPGGQGTTVLRFLKKADIPKFKNQLESINWLTEEQSKIIDADNNWIVNYPYIHRDCAAEILNAIHFGKMEVKHKTVDVNVIGLSDHSSFATDSLFCEYAYVIDLDKNVLEVYKGFNQEPLDETDRFYPLQANIKEREDKYLPVKLAKTYAFDNLPTEEVFIAECDPQEVEED